MGGLGWGLLNADIAFMSSFVASMDVLSDCGRLVWDNPFENEDGVDVPAVVPEWLAPVQTNLVTLLGERDAVFRSYKDTPKLQHHLTAKLHVILREQVFSEGNSTVAMKSIQTCGSARGALAWVYAAPRKGFIFNSTEYAMALRLLLGMPQTDVFHRSTVCCKSDKNINGSRVDNYLHHALSCGAEGSAGLRDRRHNAICRILQRALREVQVSIDVEAPVKDGRMDIVAHGDTTDWFIDVVITNPLTDGVLERTSKVKLWAAKVAEKKKFHKYSHLKENDREIVPFSVETTGGFGDSADRLLKRLSKLHSIRRAGLGQGKNFRKLLMAKISVCLMRENVYMMDEFVTNRACRVANRNGRTGN
jgi:hypothetical protein